MGEYMIFLDDNGRYAVSWNGYVMYHSTLPGEIGRLQCWHYIYGQRDAR